ncbi:VWA domain-containing protein [Tessaracoccus terricola]
MTMAPIWPILAAVLLLLALWGITTHRHRAWRRASTWRRLAMLLLVAVVGLQLQQPESSSPPPAGTDIVLVVDRTTSMGALDYAGLQPRMEGVAVDVAALTRAHPGARYTVVTTDNQARVALPWSTDPAALRTLAETMGWREAALGSGSDVTAGADLALEMLQDSATARPEATRYLVYLGDGEQTGPEQSNSFAPAGELVTDALVLGYGTTTGGQMAQHPGTDELVLADGEPAISRMDPTRLQQIADELGGTFRARTGPGGLSFWPGAPEASVEQATGGAVVSVTWLAALALLPLACWELWHATAVLAAARKELVR